MTWQPVETAPDNTPVLVYSKPDIAAGIKTRDCWFIAESFGFNEDGEIHNVTHWQPLPEPPK